MNPIEFKDQELITNYIQGNDKAMNILITRHRSQIYGFIYSEIPNKTICNDIFQDTFIKALKAIRSGSYNEQGKFLPWITQISRNLIMDHYRKTKFNYKLFKFIDENFDNIMIEESPILDHLIINQTYQDLKKIIQKLPLEQKEIILLKIFNNMTHKEIAELKKISINTSCGRLRYALQNLRKIISNDNMSFHYYD